MTAQGPMRAYDEVAACLPFAIDDVEHVNAAFERWLNTGEAENLQVVELWIYCFARRYYFAKFLQDSAPEVTDFDMLIEEAFVRAVKHLHEVEDPKRFASWFSVLCRNIYLNYCRSHRTTIELREAALSPALIFSPEDVELWDELDRLAFFRALEVAVARLPDPLREPAQLRFLEGHTYPALHEKTGYAVPTLRVYISRALHLLREDSGLRAFYDDLMQ